MTSLYVTSFSGAPGVTTAAVGLALTWHRSAMIIEADTSRTSSVIPGYLQGQIYHNVGLTPLSVAHQHEHISERNIWAQSVELADDRYLLPGFSSIGASSGTTSLWQALAPLGKTMEDAGTDVIIDAGRTTPKDPRTPLMLQADAVIIVTRPTLPDLAAVTTHIRRVRAELETVGHEKHLGILITQLDSRSYPPTLSGPTTTEIRKFTSADVVGTLPWDPRSASVYSLGTDKQTRFHKAPLQRALTRTRDNIYDNITARNKELGEKPDLTDTDEEVTV